MKKTTTQGITIREYRAGKRTYRITTEGPPKRTTAPITKPKRFEIYRHGKIEYGVRLKGGNGETICSNEGYTRKEKAWEAIADIKDSAEVRVVDLTRSRARRENEA